MKFSAYEAGGMIIISPLPTAANVVLCGADSNLLQASTCVKKRVEIEISNRFLFYDQSATCLVRFS